MDIPQCKHVLFAGCHDSGYAPFLEKFMVDSSVVERITLLEGYSVAPDISNLGFTRHIQFPSVFTSLKNTISKGPSPGQQARRFSYAVPRQQSNKLACVSKDSSGHRVDLPLSVDQRKLEDLKNHNLCHWLFLRGECRGCQRNHQYSQLTDSEFDALWYLARQGLCYKAQRGGCNDSMCIYGHGR